MGKGRNFIKDEREVLLVDVGHDDGSLEDAI